MDQELRQGARHVAAHVAGVGLIFGTLFGVLFFAGMSLVGAATKHYVFTGIGVLAVFGLLYGCYSVLRTPPSPSSPRHR